MGSAGFMNLDICLHLLREYTGDSYSESTFFLLTEIGHYANLSSLPDQGEFIGLRIAHPQ